MNQETKTTSILYEQGKKSSGSLDSIASGKTCSEKGIRKNVKKDVQKEEYFSESNKTPEHALTSAIIAGLFLTLISLVNAKFFGKSVHFIIGEIIEILGISFIFSLFVFFVSLCILQSKLKTKYKIPNTCCNTTHNKMTSTSSSLDKIWSSNLDLDSTMPGSAAHSTRQMFDRMRSQ